MTLDVVTASVVSPIPVSVANGIAPFSSLVVIGAVVNGISARSPLTWIAGFRERPVPKPFNGSASDWVSFSPNVPTGSRSSYCTGTGTAAAEERAAAFAADCALACERQ